MRASNRLSGRLIALRLAGRNGFAGDCWSGLVILRHGVFNYLVAGWSAGRKRALRKALGGRSRRPLMNSASGGLGSVLPALRIHQRAVL
jgi:hypothetical protein